MKIFMRMLGCIILFFVNAKKGTIIMIGLLMLLIGIVGIGTCPTVNIPIIEALLYTTFVMLTLGGCLILSSQGK